VLNKVETFTITPEDMEKLKPDADLNDTITQNYLKLFKFVFMPPKLEERSFFFNSFLMGKLLPEFTKEDPFGNKDLTSILQMVTAKVRSSYSSVERWTKKYDIFAKDILVVPINAFNHWFCLLVLHPDRLLNPNPSDKKCEIIYCDSMCEKRDFIVESFRCYLECEISAKKNVKATFNEGNVPCYQLLLPRQTNCHDCGLYMLAYIEELLSHPEQLENLHLVKNRRKLKLFPRTLTYTFRDRLRKLYTQLLIATDESVKNEILASYLGEKERIIKEASPSDYDQINEKEFRKYEKMNINLFSIPNLEERSYSCEVKFYVDPDINFYEKDK
jgi:Ulp1 family protease